MKKTKLFVFAASILLLLLTAGTSVYSQTEANGTVVIYHTNDTHGYIGSDGCVTIDKVAALKESTANSILVDAGDATQGAPLASLTKGEDIIELMNLAGYDLMVAGNHEFDYGTEQFLKNVSLANFPVLAANVYLDDDLLLDGVQSGNNGCHTIIEKNGITIGFFGITTTGTATSTNPEGIQGVEFVDEIETAEREIDELTDEDVDVIIAVCHMGDAYGGAPCTSQELASGLKDDYASRLDVIIDGHSHTEENEEENGILIVQTGANCAAIGKLTITVEDGNVTASESLLDASSLENADSDSEVAARLAEIQDSQSEILSEELGEISTTFWAGNINNAVAVARMEETNYGDFAADAIKAAAEDFISSVGTSEEQDMPVIAVENGGGIRAAVSNGIVTTGDLVTTFPFSNTIYIKSITPALLYDVMEASGQYLAGQDENGTLLQETVSGGFLQVSGFTVVYDTEAEVGSRVISITLDGQAEPLDRNDDTTPIFMAGNNYIMSGGDAYADLAAVDKYGEGGGELEAMEAYFLECIADGSISNYYGTQGRIQFTSSNYQPGDYTAKILIVDEYDNPVTDSTVSYRVDGGELMEATTDSEGYLAITVSCGGHGVALGGSSQEVYISNYSGFGLLEDEYGSIPQLVYYAEATEVTPAATPTASPTASPTEAPTTTSVSTTAASDASSVTTTSAATGDEQSALPLLVLIGAVMLGVGVRKKSKNKTG